MDNNECIVDETYQSVYQPKAYFMRKNTAIIGAAFLMATSAIGPGFLTQTAVFTQNLAASFGFTIVLTIIFDIVAQRTIWRTITLAGKRANVIANATIPFSGYVLSALVVIGGLAFNIGNIAGAGLGIEVLTGLDVRVGAVLSAVVATVVFVSKDAGKTLDFFTRLLGILMLLLILYIVFSAHPPIKEAIIHTFFPTVFNAKATVTLVGGTVGGYITFAGAHRLIDAGIVGPENQAQVRKSATMGILITAFLRYLLFLATLGVIARGLQLATDNPPASVFELAAGNTGKYLFGLVIWSASITSVVGAAYTSISFLKSFHTQIEQKQRAILLGFIWFSTLIFVWVGKPVKTLIFVGMLNGFILPIGLALMLMASRKLHQNPPMWLEILGWVVVVLMAILSVMTVLGK